MSGRDCTKGFRFESGRFPDCPFHRGNHDVDPIAFREQSGTAVFATVIDMALEWFLILHLGFISDLLMDPLDDEPCPVLIFETAVCLRLTPIFSGWF